MEGTILLADMNSFFASVHQALDPSLRGKPVIMGGENQRSPGAADATVQVTEGKRIIFRSTVSFDKIRQVFLDTSFRRWYNLDWRALAKGRGFCFGPGQSVAVTGKGQKKLMAVDLNDKEKLLAVSRKVDRLVVKYHRAKFGSGVARPIAEK